MNHLDRQYAEAWAKSFVLWERPARGWNVYNVACELEPEFQRFGVVPGPERPVVDDARNQGGIRGYLTRKRPGIYATALPAPPTIPGTEAPIPYYRAQNVAEILLQLPRDLNVDPAVSQQLLLSLGNFKAPVAFEIFADHADIKIQFACDPDFVPRFTTQLKSCHPEIVTRRQDGFLAQQFARQAPSEIVDFGLSNSFLFCLREFRSFVPDPIGGIIGTLAAIGAEERAAFQIMFVPTSSPWGDTVQQISAELEQRKLLNELNPAYVAAARNKLSSPLFAVSVRLLAQAPSKERAWNLIRHIGGSMRMFAVPATNELIPLKEDGYPKANHQLSFLSRTNYRSGMLLNTAELASFVHVPDKTVRSPKLRRDASISKAVPPIAVGHTTVLGLNHHEGTAKDATLSEEQRTRHVHIIGATGSGKSSMMLNMVSQDMIAGHGLCVIDPAGDLVDAICARVPDSRLDDVVLFDPSDTEYPIGFNLLLAHSDLEKTLIASDLVAAFRRMATSWGDVMDATLANAVLAILESTTGGTLIDLKKFLVEKSFRDEFLKNVQDDAVRYFWSQEFPLIAGKPQASILIRLDAFLRQRLIRNIVCQPHNRLDFRLIMDNRKILLVKLSQGTIGVENAHLLGTLIVTKLHQIALSRQDTTKRPFFAIYMDEFHNFVGPSIEPILSGIRKYNVGLALSHQEFRQLQGRSQEVAASVLSNCYTRICFRLGDNDAERFAAGFSAFDALDLKNLGIGEAIVRVERADNDFNLRTAKPAVPDKKLSETKITEVIRRSRAQFAVPRSEAERTSEITRSTQKPVATATVANDKNIVILGPAVEPKKEPAGEHQYLQNIVKRIAERYGFIARIEHPVLGGVGRVDVALEKGKRRIACEVAITNTVEYEVKNIQKCLSSGYDHVIVLSTRGSHLADIEAAAEWTIDDAQLAYVSFLQPDGLHLLLEDLTKAPSTSNTAPLIKGYKVETDFADSSTSDAEIIGNTLLEALARDQRK